MNLIDRLGCALLGVVAGAIYGALLAVGIGFATTGQFQAIYVWCTAGVFGAFGFIAGPIVGDVIVGTLHVLYGFCAGLLSGASFAIVDPEPRASGTWRNLFL